MSCAAATATNINLMFNAKKQIQQGDICVWAMLLLLRLMLILLRCVLVRPVIFIVVCIVRLM